MIQLFIIVIIIHTSSTAYLSGGINKHRGRCLHTAGSHSLVFLRFSAGVSSHLNCRDTHKHTPKHPDGLRCMITDEWRVQRRSRSATDMTWLRHCQIHFLLHASYHIKYLQLISTLSGVYPLAFPLVWLLLIRSWVANQMKKKKEEILQKCTKTIQRTLTNAKASPIWLNDALLGGKDDCILGRSQPCSISAPFTYKTCYGIR